ncbi:alpha/beta hydrolase [Microbacterium sp.]|uniref:alpha/beta fold hydrolase n=1 Tax=Microbacterium sp. TaxID=51671 RepID=UPI00333E9880
MANDTDEFRYLPAQAAALGTDLPAAERLSLTLPDGRALSAIRYGEGEPEATLLHGAGLNAHTWDTTVLLLRRPTLVIDLAGHGDSSWREDIDYTPHTLADDVVVALQTWTARPQVLVGQSLGGLTAAAVAAAHPELVAALMIVDITPGIDTAAAPAVLARFYEQTDFATRDEAVDRAISHGFGGTRPDTERGVFLNTRVRDDGRVEWKHHFAHLAAHALGAVPERPEAAVVRADQGWADLASVRAPIAFVRGASGFVSEGDMAEFAHRVPAASIVTLDATHNVQETAPAELAALISDRLDATPR